MTQDLNWAVAGGEAASRNQAQPIRQNGVLRRFFLGSADWTMLALLRHGTSAEDWRFATTDSARNRIHAYLAPDGKRFAVFSRAETTGENDETA